jgi:kynurenine 3-monooxygenase
MANTHAAFTHAPSLAIESLTLFRQRPKAQSCGLRMTTRTAVAARMASDQQSIVVVGGDLYASAAASALARMGNRYAVTMFDSIAEPTVEPAPDSFLESARAFPNITMSVTQRGVRVLENIGVLVSDNLRIFTPAAGRMLHQKYSKPVAAYGAEPNLYTALKSDVTSLCRRSAQEAGVRFRYGCKLEALNLEGKSATFVVQSTGSETESTVSINYDLLIGSDGVSSRVRAELLRHRVIDLEVLDEQAEFKLLRMPPLSRFRHYDEQWLKYIHTWSPILGPGIICPLPVFEDNTDSSTTTWTAVVVLGQSKSEDILGNPDSVKACFEKYFPDVVYALETSEYDDEPQSTSAGDGGGRDSGTNNSSRGMEAFCNEVASFPKLKGSKAVCCSRLSFGHVALVGDAAHPMSSSLGQGLNCGLEDIGLFVNAVTSSQGNVESALLTYDKLRRPDVDAIIRLSYRAAGGKLLSRLENAMAYTLRRGVHKVLPNLVGSSTLLGDLGRADVGYKSIFEEQMLFVKFLRGLAVILASVLGIAIYNAR